MYLSKSHQKFFIFFSSLKLVLRRTNWKNYNRQISGGKSVTVDSPSLYRSDGIWRIKWNYCGSLAPRQDTLGSQLHIKLLQPSMSDDPDRRMENATTRRSSQDVGMAKNDNWAQISSACNKTARDVLRVKEEVCGTQKSRSLFLLSSSFLQEAVLTGKNIQFAGSSVGLSPGAALPHQDVWCICE